jgi:serine/threonine protein kinase
VHGSPSIPGYDVTSVLGRGAMGVVYQARELATGREVAIKVLLGEVSAARMERFRREAELTARLNHPGILPVHTAGVSEGRPYVVYDLIKGARPFEEACAGLSAPARCQLVLSCADALAAAHAANIIHRDLKGDNVLVDPEGRVLLIDFGVALARDLERLTQTGGIVGTPHAMSPEQFSGRCEPLPTIDVWALGVLLYWALTDRYPFVGENVTDLLMKIARSEPAPPESQGLEREVSLALDRLCLRALEKDASRRPQDAAAFGTELRTALEARRSRPPLAIGLAGAVALLLIGAVSLLGLGALKGDRAAASPSPKDTVASAPSEAAALEIASPTPTVLTLPELPQRYVSEPLPPAYFQKDPILWSLYEAAQGGDTKALYDLASYLQERKYEMERVRGEILRLLYQVLEAEPGHAEALRRVAQAYEDAGEDSLSLTCLELSVKAGSAKAAHDLAERLKEEDPAANAARCFELYRLAATRGNQTSLAVMGQLYLGISYGGLQGHPVDDARAVALLRRVIAEAKWRDLASTAKIYLAQAVLSRGKKLPGVSVEEAEEFLAEAIAANNSVALTLEGDLHRFGRFREQDYEVGKSWYRRAHETGQPQCTMQYVTVLLEGDSEDKETARQVLRELSQSARYPGFADMALRELKRLDGSR